MPGPADFRNVWNQRRKLSPEEYSATMASYRIREAFGQEISKSFALARRRYLKEALALAGGRLSDHDWMTEAARQWRLAEICEYLAWGLSQLPITAALGREATKEDVLEAVHAGFPATRGKRAVKLHPAALAEAFRPHPSGARLNQSRVDRQLAAHLHCDERSIRVLRRRLRGSK